MLYNIRNKYARRVALVIAIVPFSGILFCVAFLSALADVCEEVNGCFRMVWSVWGAR